jgi:hypothetical protein
MATVLGVTHRWYNGSENGTLTASAAVFDHIASLLRLTRPSVSICTCLSLGMGRPRLLSSPPAAWARC